MVRPGVLSKIAPLAEYAAKVTCGAAMHERVSARLLWSAWNASNMDIKEWMCSHGDPDSTGCMRAHLLSARRPSDSGAQSIPEHSLSDDAPGGTVRSCGEGGHTIGQRLATGCSWKLWALEVCTVRIRFAAGSAA